MEVRPEELLFTQDSIACRFRRPHQHCRIDDAVDSILDGTRQASDFPRLQVVHHEGRLWSLDNRRLWVFRKAGVQKIAVDLVSYAYHSRFPDLIENKPWLKTQILREGFLPEVRGYVRENFVRSTKFHGRDAFFAPGELPFERTSRLEAPEERELEIPSYRSQTEKPKPKYSSTSAEVAANRVLALDEDATKPGPDRPSAAGSTQCHPRTDASIIIFVVLAVLVVALFWASKRRRRESKLQKMLMGASQLTRRVQNPSSSNWFVPPAVNWCRKVLEMVFDGRIIRLLFWLAKRALRMGGFGPLGYVLSWLCELLLGQPL